MIKKILLSSVAIFSLAFSATYKAGVSFDGIAKGQIGSPTPLKSANVLDTGKIIFSGSIDNVDAEVTFSRVSDDVANAVGMHLQFDSAHVTVNNLFNGLLTLRFYDWSYGAVETDKYDNVVLPDYGFQGFYATLKPIELLEIGLGYGIQVAAKTDDARSAVVGGKRYSTSTKDNGTHGVRAHVKVNNNFVPATLYVGAILNDGAHGSSKIVTTTNTQNKSTQSLSTTQRNAEAIHQINVGLDLDPAYMFLPGWFKVYVGFTPGSGSATKLYTTTTTTSAADGTINKITEENELTISAGLYGVLDFGAFGLNAIKVDHAWQFSSDTFTKRKVYVNDGAIGGDLFSIYLKPKYTLGQFTFGIPFYFGIIGEKNSAYSSKANVDSTGKAVADFKGAEGFNRFSVGLDIDWVPAPGITISPFYTFASATSLDYHITGAKVADWEKTTQTVGLEVAAAFATSSEN